MAGHQGRGVRSQHPHVGSDPLIRGAHPGSRPLHMNTHTLLTFHDTSHLRSRVSNLHRYSGIRGRVFTCGLVMPDYVHTLLHAGTVPS